MKIALFSTNFYPTPPLKEKTIYAPLWLTYQLAEGLVKKGHQVFLFGSSDSKTKAKLISNNLPSLRKNKAWFRNYKKLGRKWGEITRANYELFLVSKLYQMAKEFDIIHFHSYPRVLHFAPLVKTPVCFTLHNPINYPPGTDTLKLIYTPFKKIKNIHFISISKAQRKPLPTLNYAATVYNGTNVKKFSFNKKKGDYLAFAGRIIPLKGVDIAVQAARKTGQKLKIAGPIPSSDSLDYWNKKIKPYLSRKITYEGMLNSGQMVSFYQGAKALLLPTLLEESFGLVMTEAMACGTPVIAFKIGSIPEVVKHNKTGYVVKNQKGMIESIKKIDRIKREDCRKWVEKNFSLDRMINNYEKTYLKILKK